MRITGPQLKTLQTLFSLRCPDASRAERLAWASARLGRGVASFRDLSGEDAGELISELKAALGQPTSSRPRREAAQARGTHGRKGHAVKVEMMASPENLAEIERLRVRAGMSLPGFEAWLRSRRSPLHGRAEARLLTVSDCNRVRWALLRMIRRAESHAQQATNEAGREAVAAAARP